jgi:hypothetical protein
LPKKGDPYNEIYKVLGRWYSLFREDWINPSAQALSKGGGTFERTCQYLDRVQNFHRLISGTFHPNSYAHYGADRDHQSFGEVVWEIKNCADPAGWQNWSIVSDSRQGKLGLKARNKKENKNIDASVSDGKVSSVYAEIHPPTSPGDQTVPAKSADHQLNSGMFKGIFRQVGYEHQSSYKDPGAVASTLYSILRIAQNATWNCEWN